MTLSSVPLNLGRTVGEDIQAGRRVNLFECRRRNDSIVSGFVSPALSEAGLCLVKGDSWPFMHSV